MAPWLFFPDYRRLNPYQTLLARALSPAFDARAGTIRDALAAPMPAETVLHLHWEDAVTAPAMTAPDAAARIASWLDDLDAFRGKGGRFVWTMHNAAPHEDRHPDLSALFRQTLARRADLVHVHGETAAALARAAGAGPDTILVLPHPHLRDATPDDITDDAARRHFGFSQSETVFAFLGAIRPYKGVDLLVNAFAALHATHPSARLILAGRPALSTDTARIVAGLGPGIAATTLLPRFIEPGAIQLVMRAADFVVLPYRTILTSGAIMLALGFGRPVIIPALPALLEVATDGHDALTFAPCSEIDLHDTLRAACARTDSQRARMKANARITADAVSFAQLGRALTRWASACPP